MTNNEKVISVDSSLARGHSMKENRGLILLICCVATIGGFYLGVDSVNK